MSERNTRIRGNQIKSDTVEPADLDATNSPADNQVPTYDSATGDFTWEAQGGEASATRGTFTNANLSSGKLTITHNKGLSAPYTILIQIYDNNGKMILPDEITGSTNSVEIDLSSFGSISGTWGYIYIA